MVPLSNVNNQKTYFKAGCSNNIVVNNVDFQLIIYTKKCILCRVKRRKTVKTFQSQFDLRIAKIAKELFLFDKHGG